MSGEVHTRPFHRPEGWVLPLRASGARGGGEVGCLFYLPCFWGALAERTVNW